MDSQGAVDSLVGRLTTILVDEAQLLGGLRGDVEFIKDEMDSMNSLLLHLTESQHRSHQVRTWMKHVVSLSNDCEGNVELYVRYVAGADPRGNKDLLGYLRRILQRLRTLPARHRVATRIRELKVRARDVGDRRLRYGVTVPPALPEQGRTVADKPAPQLGGPEEEEDLRRRELLLYGEPPDTVEEGTKNVLEYLLHDHFEDFVHISIYGEGGAGKTAVARKVYEHPSVVSAYEYKAWINFGGLKWDYNEVWLEIELQFFRLNKEGYDLRGKKILIVCDDVAIDQDGQRTIDLLCTFFKRDSRFRGRVVTTTKSTISGGVFNGDWGDVTLTFRCETRPKFFRRRAFELARCELSPIVAILEKCYHDVFAMHMLLHLLYVNPRRSRKEMEHLGDALANNRNTTAKVMLMFCYNELPSNYKSCLLYLSIFPQDHKIRRTDLLRRWVAEGLITKRSVGMSTMDDQAERIFDSLVARGFIRSVETSDAGKIKSCTVHHIVHEFITTDVGFGDTLLRPDLAHRFSINSGVALQEESPPESDHPSHVILTLLESLPGSAQWQLLKVLDLEGCKGLKKKHLNSICKILLLKYLSLRNTDVTELPRQIEKLQCLQTLDIRQTIVRGFATKSVALPMLKHLLAGQTESASNNSVKFQESFATVHIPSGIRRMKKLEILSHVEVSSTDDLSDVGQLLQLRKLGVVLHGKEGSLRVLFQQIEKLHGCLRSLSIRINQPTTSEGTLSSPPRFLRSLNISGITSELPLWIAELDQLTKITLSETDLGEDGLSILGKLRILRCLRLRHKSYTRSELKFKEEEFKSLKSLVVEGSNITNITFDTGAAPKLQMIVWSFASMESLSEVNHLPNLKKVELNGDSRNADQVRQAIKDHRNHPDFKHNGRLLHQD